MAIYTPINAKTFRGKTGSLSDKLAQEFKNISVAVDTAEKAEVAVTIGSSASSLAAAGFDLADGTGGTTYGVFVAPFDMEILGADLVLTEAYVKDTDDAKVEIKDNASSPVTKADVTLPAAGGDAKSVLPMDVKSSTVAAGDILNVAISSTAASTGTGHGLVVLKYRKA